MTFCARCGQQIAEGTQACPHCGQPPEITWQSVAAQTAPAAALYPPAVSYSAAPAGPRGVQGWLLFFCIFLAIVSPAATLWLFWMSGLRVRDLSRGFLVRPDIVIDLVLRVVSGLVAGVLGWIKSRSAMIFLRIYYAWSAVIMVISVLSLVRVFMRVHGTVFIVGALSRLAASVAFSVAGILYFSLSKRVRNTLGSNFFG